MLFRSVITPVLKPLDLERLRRLRENSCTVELFVLGEELQSAGELRGREFPIYSVQDFGSELIHR